MTTTTTSGLVRHIHHHHRRQTLHAGSTEGGPADLGCTAPSHRSARRTCYGHPPWLGAGHAHGHRRPFLSESCQLRIAPADGGDVYPWFQRACRLLRRRSQPEVLWQRHARLACLFTELNKPSFPSGKLPLPRTLSTLVVFEQLESLEGSTASDELVGELGLVVVASAILVDLLVGVLRVSCTLWY